MTIAIDGDRVSDCDTAADFTTMNSGANVGGDGDVAFQGTFAVGDKMSGTNELLVSDTLSGGASGVYDFSSGGADEGKHFIGYCNVKNNIVTDGTGFQIYFGNASGHNGSWYVDSATYAGGYVPRVIDPTRTFDTAGTWTVGGNPAQLDDVSRMGFEFNISGTIMGSFNNVLADTFSVGFGIRAASNRFTFGTTSGVSTANDTITATSHAWPSGTPVYYDKEGGSVDIGLTDATIYYINADGANTVTLHATRADGIADTSPINLTATGAETHSITPAYDMEDVAVHDQDTQIYGWWTRVQGAYIGRGKIRIGPSTGNAEARWSSADQTIIFADELVGAGFYEVDMRGTDTLVEWTRMAVSAAVPETTAKRWDFTALTGFGTTSGFGFTDTDGIWKNAENITLRADCTLTGTTFIDCTLITQNGATLDGCTILEANTADGGHAILADDPGLIDNCNFTFSDGHAIRCDTTGTYSMTGNTFTGYGSAGTNDAAFYNNSGGLITLQIGADDVAPTIRNGGISTTTIVATVDVNVHVQDRAGADIQHAVVSVHRATPTAHTAGAGNTAGDGDLVITAAIDSDQPQAGYLTVLDRSTELTQGYRYVSWDTSTFTFATTVSGSATSETPNSTDLISTSTNFLTADIEEGDTIRNTTSGDWAVVDEIVDANNITTTPLQGAGDNLWNTSDGFSVHDLATTLVSGTDIVDLPLSNGQTDVNGDAPTLAYDKTEAPTAVRVRIRYQDGATKYIPFVTTGTISATTGLTLDITLDEDTVAT